jgi:hypothetical protein
LGAQKNKENQEISFKYIEIFIAAVRFKRKWKIL